MVINDNIDESTYTKYSFTYLYKHIPRDLKKNQTRFSAHIFRYKCRIDTSFHKSHRKK